MNKPVVIVGVGEMGGVFARGLLRNGHPVYPITRLMDIKFAADEMPEPVLVLLSVAESDLHPILEVMPEGWRDRIGLLQNELLPRDWRAHDIGPPTVISVWFEKKPGQDFKVLISSPVFGSQAAVICDALGCLEIPCHVVPDEEALLYELVRKNLYILTTNIAGLVSGGTVGKLWRDHRALVQAVGTEVLDIQETLTGITLPREKLMAGMVEIFDADPDHQCTGRSAPARLRRALQHAEEAGIQATRLREIQKGLAD